ncbi:hypothetical protein O0555_01490 [Brevibacillus laterosporus]|uniref:hypothetical protein n=1 Tax=Brevibacillus laterosporus TaxID=1465 RepID=UPI0015E1E815|nr:hypothetical protein [Brevibacillus laterosporus]MCR8936031.1 hypothetical protein [Brevibacillus laterosporus]MCZ0838670.1 hypothetical protein [Brevibacillus laterosporus]MCZ0843171.1 hypothetical protein [Brevibacillus laterosporus]MED1910522.1 hypothetical protein [Brevibacillus laterosporus]
MLAWGSSDPIDCTQLQKDKKKAQGAIDFQKSKEEKCITEGRLQSKNKTGVLLYDSSKTTCSQSNTGRDRTPSQVI